MGKGSGSGTETAEGGSSLSVRIPVIDDPADREIGENRVVRTGMPGGGAAGGEHPVALPGTNGVNGHQLLALVVLENAQVHVIQTGNPVGADQRSHHLLDLHQAPAPPGGLVVGAEVGAGVGAAVFGGSGSQ